MGTPIQKPNSESNPDITLPENRTVAKQGGTIAGNARKQIEKKSGKKVITKSSAKRLKLIK
ncbi:hypothetical protein A2690_04280 [Candidatus Roizmanbacteria bacterium RIFCSPHIGHO2_01_FULL_39_12b]|uniref:Uncharacterized protein n=1 Tax=Candidatus Roizmanbacteria bacterium RIFCSPHIGHO2_01_FULL_39_12b TaxID=1802030 RepID=A0A1F7GCC9_9BACT|nr:MAG: hypothetical protein A2690_04280 [Candidatus Roizmanbacteria bacterium RIFCSPHIGHO2_01_FULL_39_12b]OGK47158.1 MAG: hypothetical protein A3B46_02005 [Candidatus Roizmanbacteria bacterium RIFCSPLOWO2_01_FULL_39_19]